MDGSSTRTAATCFWLLRVLGLRDELADAAEFRRFRPAIEKANLGSLFRPVLNLGDHGGDGDHTDRQQRPAQQVIQKTALAGLEPAQNRDVESLLLGEGLAALQKLFQGADLVAPAESHGLSLAPPQSRGASCPAAACFWTRTTRTSDINHTCCIERSPIRRFVACREGIGTNTPTAKPLQESLAVQDSVKRTPPLPSAYTGAAFAGNRIGLKTIKGILNRGARIQ